MADYKKLIPFILQWEGGFVNDPADAGGATNKGITIGTFRQFYGQNKTVDDLKAITAEQWHHIFKYGYWDRWKADLINSQKIADILVDWVWASGKYGIIIPQRLVGVVDDGIVGAKTLAAINAQHPDILLQRIYNARVAYIEDIIRKSIENYEKKIGRKSTQEERLKYTNERFRRGWMNRLNALR